LANDLTVNTSVNVRAGSRAFASLLVGLIFVGFALRVWRIGAQSLWLDEALSVVFARPSLRPLLALLISEDLHPPLYYVALHYWMAVSGQSEFAVRFLSLLTSLPAVPLTYAFGVALFRSPRRTERDGWARAVGVGGATLLAISPFMVYYAQEARMYSLLATLGVLSAYTLWKVLTTGGRRWWAAHAIATAALLYTQYFGALVVAFEGIYLLGSLLVRRRGALAGLLSLAAAGALYVPWLPGAFAQMQRLLTIPDFWKGDFQLSFFVTHIFGAFALGNVAAFQQLGVLVAVPALLLGGGLGWLAWRGLRSGTGELYLLTSLLIPLAVLYAVLVRDPKFTERYLIMIVPAFYLAIASGLIVVVRWFARSPNALVRRADFGVAAGLTFGLVAASLFQVWQVYDGDAYRKDDNRAAVTYIDQRAQPGDIVVLMMNAYQAYVYYSNGSVPYVGLQPGGDVQSAATSLNAIARGHKRIWLLEWNPEWADPTGYVRQSLAAAYREEPISQPFWGLQLKLYLVDPNYTFSVRTTPSVPAAADYGNRLQLLGYDLPQKQVVAGTKQPMTFYWKALQNLPNDYIVSIRLTDGQFYWWRADDRPAAFNYPTMYWPVNQVVTGQRTLEIPPGTPPGVYHLEVGVYPQGGSDLDVLRDGQVPAGTAADVGTIVVARPSIPVDVTKLSVPQRDDVTYGGDLRLVGQAPIAPRASPGGTVDVTLWWQALRSALPDDRVHLVLASGSYNRVIADEAPVGGRYPTSGWAKDEIVTDRHRVIIPADAPAGPVQLRLEVWPAGGTSVLGSPLVLGTTTILDQKRQLSPPSNVPVVVNWRVGSFAQVVGYGISQASVRPGDHLQLTVYWHALGNSGDTSYTVFAHLLDQQSLVKAQQDHPPGQGEDPTTGWLAGEYVVDRYELDLPASQAPGPLQIEIGMYNPQTGARLPVLDASGNPAGDRIILGTITVQP
jgi:uncharacterized membrane protein